MLKLSRERKYQSRRRFYQDLTSVLFSFSAGLSTEWSSDGNRSPLSSAVLKVVTRSARRAIYICPIAALALTGCDLSREINENTLAISSTVTQIHNQQILENLESIIEDGYAIPAQVTLSGGGVQVTNSIQPSFANFIQPWKNLSASYTNSYTQNWAVSPVNDPDDIRRLRALYRFAVYGYHGNRAGYDEATGKCRYPVSPIFCEVSKNADINIEYPKPVLSDTSVAETNSTQYKDNKILTYTKGTNISANVLNTNVCQTPQSNPSCPTYPYYTPNYQAKLKPDTEAVISRLELPVDWLYWSELPFGPPMLPHPPRNQFNCVLVWSHYFTTATFHSLYSCSTVSRADAWKQFDEFALWVSSATINSLGLSGASSGSGSQGGNSGGGGGGKSKATPAPVLTNPVH